MALDRLGLVIIDEQHKFGVAQRERLVRKGTYPHLLVMTATPIPRTLGLTLYGDLDLSVIDELPTGRGQIRTFVRAADKLPKVWEFIRGRSPQGRQAYVVYPRVEETDRGRLKAVTEEFERLAEPARAASGRVAARPAARRGEGSGDGRASGQPGQVLLATSVIEVGVDVPNATVMLIENAEQFGLAQLHQLRGRIGRGAHESYCILVAELKTEAAIARLRVLSDTGRCCQLLVQRIAHHPQPLVGGLSFQLGHQDAVRLVRAPADASAQLVQLGQAELLGVLDQHDAWRWAHPPPPRSREVASSTCTSVGAERRHHRFLLLRRAAGRAAGPPGCGANSFCRCANSSVTAFSRSEVRLLDPRIDHIGLPPLGDLAADEFLDLGQLVRPRTKVRTRPRPGGSCVDDRDIEIAVEGQAQGARDGRGGHDQQMRVAPLRTSCSRWATPNLCCSSMITSPSRRRETTGSSNACVPMTRSVANARGEAGAASS